MSCCRQLLFLACACSLAWTVRGQRVELPDVATCVQIQGPVSDLLAVPQLGRSLFPMETINGTPESIYAFVANNMHVWNASLDMDPSTLLFGTGFGLCGEQSRVLTGLWSRFGYQSRIVALPGHTLTELADPQWTAYDPQHRVIYRYGGRGYSVSELRSMTSWIDVGLDPIGYDFDIMLSVLRDGEIRTIQPAPMHLPLISLAQNQTAYLRRRLSTAQTWLPLTKHPDTRARSNLIPLYELVVLTKHAPGLPVDFLIQLPVIDIGLDGFAELSAQAPGFLYDEDGLLQRLRGTRPGFQLATPHRAQSRVTYLVAGWFGDRLTQVMAAVHKQDPELTRWLDVGNKPQSPVWIDGLSVRRRGIRLEFDLRLAWRGMTGSASRRLNLNLEKLSSALELEAVQSVARTGWTWTPQMGPQGIAHLSFDWRIQGGPQAYRDPNHRTFLARIDGEGIFCGDNWMRIDLDLNRL